MVSIGDHAATTWQFQSGPADAAIPARCPEGCRWVTLDHQPRYLFDLPCPHLPIHQDRTVVIEAARVGVVSGGGGLAHRRYRSWMPGASVLDVAAPVVFAVEDVIAAARSVGSPDASLPTDIEPPWAAPFAVARLLLDLSHHRRRARLEGDQGIATGTGSGRRSASDAADSVRQALWRDHGIDSAAVDAAFASVQPADSTEVVGLTSWVAWAASGHVAHRSEEPAAPGQGSTAAA